MRSRLGAAVVLAAVCLAAGTLIALGQLYPAMAVGLLGTLGAAAWSGHWQRWVAIIRHREPATGLALYRIAAGLCVVLTIGGVMWAGVWDLIWVDQAHGGYRALPTTWLVAWLGGTTREVIWGLCVANLVAGTVLTMGLGGRGTALATSILFAAVTDLNGDAGGSYDELLSNGLWLLVLANSTATLSVDCRLRTGAWTSSRPVAAWPRYLLVFQLFLCYWTTGLQKLSTYWVPGGDFSALYYIFQQPSWARYDLSWMAWVFPLTQLATAVTWFWEVGAFLLPLAFFYRATRTRPGRLRAFANALDLRTAYAAIGVIMHLSLWVLMDVGPFSPISLSYYFALWHHDEIVAAVRRFRGSRVVALLPARLTASG